MKQKKILLHITGYFLFLFTINVHSQEYVPFPDSNSIWSEVFTNEQPFEIETYQYGISGDTIINSKQYNKIYSLNDTVYPLVTGQYCGAIREDSLKKIFVIDCDCAYHGTGEEEVILYDFSKSVGDTVFVGMYNIGPMGYYIIDYIDSMLIDDNYRKTFHFLGYEEYWIEGIGSTRGLFSSINDQPTGFQKWKLICFNQDDIVKYLNPEFNSCFPLLTEIKALQQKNINFKIYPHPVTDISIIDLNNMESEYQYIELFNVFGQRINQINIKGRKQIIIKRINYKSGLFVYHISGQNMKPVTGKIIFE